MNAILLCDCSGSFSEKSLKGLISCPNGSLNSKLSLSSSELCEDFEVNGNAKLSSPSIPPNMLSEKHNIYAHQQIKVNPSVASL